MKESCFRLAGILGSFFGGGDSVFRVGRFMAKLMIWNLGAKLSEHATTGVQGLPHRRRKRKGYGTHVPSQLCLGLVGYGIGIAQIWLLLHANPILRSTKGCQAFNGPPSEANFGPEALNFRVSAYPKAP